MTKSAENIEKKIEAQLEKLKQLKAQKQAIEARKRNRKSRKERMILGVKFCSVLT
jgi:urease accessory protein UreF